MSNKQTVFLRKESVPNHRAWQGAVEALGFALELDPGINPFEVSGFAPCRLADESSGFELLSGPATAHADALRELNALIGERDYCLSFTWGDERTENACALIAAAALAVYFDAIVVSGDQAYDTPGVLAAAREVLRHA